MSLEALKQGEQSRPGTPAQQVSYEVREYDPQDEGAVIQFLKLVLGEGGTIPRTSAFWQWKHIHNPFGASRVLLAANHEILGLRAFMRWRFRTPGGTLSAVRPVDTCTHPGVRRLGIFSALTREALTRVRSEGTNLVFNTPNAQSMPGYLKMGWQQLDRPRLLFRPLKPLRMAAVFARRRFQSPPAADVPGFFKRTPRTVSALLEHENRVERFLEFEDQLAADGIRTDRSAAFLRWRYASAPVLPYFAHWIGDRPVTGFLIYRPYFRLGMRGVMLCEIALGYGAMPHFVEMIRDLIRTVNADYLMASACLPAEHRALLRGVGFWHLPPTAGLNFVVQPLEVPAGTPDPRRLESWRLSLGDLEVF